MRLSLWVLLLGCVSQSDLLVSTDAAAPPDVRVAELDVPIIECPASTPGDMDGDMIPDYRDPFPMFCQTSVFDESFRSELWEMRGDFTRDEDSTSGRDGIAFRELEPAGNYFVETELRYEDEGDSEWRVGFALGFATPFDLECEVRFEPSLNRDQQAGEVLVWTNVETDRSESPVYPRFPASDENVLYLQMITAEETTRCRLFDSRGLVGESAVPHNSTFPGPAEDARVLADGRRVRFTSFRSFSL